MRDPDTFYNKSDAWIRRSPLTNKAGHRAAGATYVVATLALGKEAGIPAHDAVHARKPDNLTA